TGELAYGGEGVPSRILRLSVFGEADQGDPLPLQTGDGPILLVNLHPSRAAPSVVED
ncbi:MAG: hypothetical protein GWN85_10400, partial [Gemmatimonadetes bacterium]|nr:hypothetical protein [Gemmatimonadota bacterium]NIR36191.1 hypothetical protein [Actinomycetota bacterium]NIS30471.1 hypothetical protein [Actinomycetota bacterium]NIT95077.1 hypothetical protein [Actinomycetota bacterium]NIU65697.1 hypothetical protein [Actinomycetota bacterium]